MDVVQRILTHLDEHDPGSVVGVHLYGSAVRGGLRPDSDLDLLLLTERPLAEAERRSLTDLLLAHSGRRATVAPGRPVELTAVVRPQVVPWRYPPVCDFQYGEWLRDELATGALPRPHADPDLAVLITSARETSDALRGRPVAEVTDAVPPQDLRRALGDSLAGLVADFHGDERNVLLTLARMVVTLDTGRIESKDTAAQAVSSLLPDDGRDVLRLAGRAYRGEAADDWTRWADPARVARDTLVAEVRRRLYAAGPAPRER